MLTQKPWAVSHGVGDRSHSLMSVNDTANDTVRDMSPQYRKHIKMLKFCHVFLAFVWHCAYRNVCLRVRVYVRACVSL